MIYKQMDVVDFVYEFHNWDKGEDFSPAGLEALYDYFDNRSDFVSFDRLEIWCKWTEFPDLADIAKAFMFPTSWSENEIRRYLQEQTTLLEFDGGVIIKHKTGGLKP